MILFRHARAAAIFGQGARQFVAPSIAQSTPSLVAHAMPHPVSSIRPQTRFNSTDASAATLSPPDAESPSTTSLSAATSPGDGSDIPGLAPWKLHQLRREEIEAYRSHGPNYMEHISPHLQKVFKMRAVHRERWTTLVQNEVGEHGFAALQAWHNDEAAVKRSHEATKAQQDDHNKRREELMRTGVVSPKAAARKALERTLYDEMIALRMRLKASKLEDLKAIAKRIEREQSEH